MRENRILCDECSADLASHNGGETKFRISVTVERIPSTSNVVYTMMYYPPLDDKDFCSVACLLANLGDS